MWVLGLVLQVVGTVLAIGVLVHLKETTTRRPSWLRLAYRRVRGQLQRLLRRPFVVTGTMAAEIDVAISGHGIATMGELPDGTPDARIAFIYERLRNLEQRHNDLRIEVGDHAQVEEAAVLEVRRAVAESADQVRGELLDTIGGLDLEVWALALILVGSVLTSVYG